MQALRATVLATSLLISGGAVAWFQSTFHVDSVPPDVPLSAIPLRLLDWSGQDVALRDDTARVLGAHSYLNRVYRDPIDREVILHAAVFTTPQFRGGAPHHPEICYPAAGWQVVQRQNDTVTGDSGELAFQMILFQRGTDRVVTAHWYEVGDETFISASGGRSQLFRSWRDNKLPCTEKFLVELTQPSIAAAKPTVESFLLAFQAGRANHRSESNVMVQP